MATTGDKTTSVGSQADRHLVGWVRHLICNGVEVALDKVFG
jgi:hypothetical protein